MCKTLLLVLGLAFVASPALADSKYKLTPIRYGGKVVGYYHRGSYFRTAGNHASGLRPAQAAARSNWVHTKMPATASYQMATGRRPYEELSPDSIRRRVRGPTAKLQPRTVQ